MNANNTPEEYVLHNCQHLPMAVHLDIAAAFRAGRRSALGEGCGGEMVLGVGEGSGQLFVHGDYDSIKAAQKLLLEAEELARWKREQLAITPDWQAIAKALGIPLGESIPDKILPYIERLERRLREAIAGWAEQVNRLTAEIADPWQPIETAPQDGTEVSLWCRASKRLFREAKWNSLRGRWAIWSVDEYNDPCWCNLESWEVPTHWCLLPKPPTKEGA